jgi:putative copper export protein
LNAAPDLVRAAFHWLEYLGLLFGLGCFVVRRAGRLTPRIAWANPPMHLGFGAAVAGGLGLLAVAPSWWVGVRVAAEAAALVLCLRGIPLVAPFGALAAVLLPFAGHAAAVAEPAGAEFADALHVLSAAMWAGGILALASLRPPAGWTSPEALELLERFGRVAFLAFAVTALTGVLRATEQLRSLDLLWTTGYGLVLVAKAIGVGSMAALSLAWRRGAPVRAIEAAVAVAVVGATALMAAFPLTAPH